MTQAVPEELHAHLSCSAVLHQVCPPAHGTEPWKMLPVRPVREPLVQGRQRSRNSSVLNSYAEG